MTYHKKREEWTLLNYTLHDLEGDIMTYSQAQLASSSKQIGDFSSKSNVIPFTPSAFYEYCHMFGHTTFECGFVNNNMYGDSMIGNCSYVGGPLQPRQPNNPFSNTYNQGWMNYLKKTVMRLSSVVNISLK